MDGRGFELAEPNTTFAQRRVPEPDLLNDVLGALRVVSSALYIFDFHEPWEIDLQDTPVSISWTIMEGTVWLHGPGNSRTELGRGDTFLLPHRGAGRSRVVVAHSEGASGRNPARAMDLFRKLDLQGFEGDRAKAGVSHRMHARWGGQGPATRIVSAAFGLTDSKLGPLIAGLPELIVVRAADTGSDLVDILEHLALDHESARDPGFSALVTQVAQLLLAHIVRTYALSTGSALGWLGGLGDPQIGRALASIHREPARRWNVATLARAAGLSRSVFAARFYAQVGYTAMNYVRAWRMHLAREALAGSDISVSALSMDLGYQSEAAFRAGFRRETGQSPSEFRRLERPRPDFRQVR